MHAVLHVIAALVAALCFCLPARSAELPSCPEIRWAVAQYGEAFVTRFARSQGFTHKQIAEAKRRCLKDS